MGSQGGWGQSKEFLDLVKSIGEARSKAEEDRIVLREIETLKRRIAEPDVPRRKMKEYIIRLVYVEMLGHDASFGYIHAVKMTHDDSVFLKRTGYLAVTIFLNEDHDLIILIVNTIQKDLRSDNYLVVCAALTAVCKLINEETIPAVLPQVVELLGHPKEAVRKKAVMALHRFYQRAPTSVSHLLSNFRKKLCDNDPGVMGATLCPLFDLISADASSYKDLVVSFVNILKQVAERRLPKTYDYHQMPAPFIQVKLLKILALLGSGDKQVSGHMYTVLADIFRKCETSSNIGNAVLYEAICCASSIYPNSKILDAAVETTSNFLKSDNHNLKYMGIDALGRLIKISPDIAEEHQLAVIDCLEDPDDTLKRKTFELLYKMTKSSNVEVIVDRMIGYMISIIDNHYKTEIASRCVELAEQFAPSNQWFIQTMNKVFEHAGELVNPKLAHNLMRLIAEGFGEDDEGADSQLRSSAVRIPDGFICRELQVDDFVIHMMKYLLGHWPNHVVFSLRREVDSYLRILGEPKLPSMFLQVICWVLGEYGTADGKYSVSYIIGKLCDVAEAHINDDTVKAYAMTGIMKICAFEIAAGRKVEMLSECQTLIDELSDSHSTDLQQRAYELQALLSLDNRTIENVMPSDASCEDIEVDKNLSFLNFYVQKSIEKGAQPYLPESERSGMSNVDNFKNPYQHENSGQSLRFEAYELPKPPPPTSIPFVSSSSRVTDIIPVSEQVHSREIHQNPPTSGADALALEVKLRLDGVQKKWGRPTYSSVPAASATVSKENGVTHSDEATNANSQTRDFPYNHRRQQVEVSAEKQRLAASLFGSSSKSDKKAPSSHRPARGGHVNSERPPATALLLSEPPKEKTSASVPPPPDLLDFSDPLPSSATSEDPFKQLEGLVDTTIAPLSGNAPTPDIIPLYGGTPSINSATQANIRNASAAASGVVTIKKGPNAQDALEKDAVARQVGVQPTQNNPNLFRDLLG